MPARNKGKPVEPRRRVLNVAEFVIADIDPLSRKWHVALEHLLNRLADKGLEPTMKARQRAVWIYVPVEHEAVLASEIARMLEEDTGLENRDGGVLPSTEMLDEDRYGAVLTSGEMERAHEAAGEH